MIICGTVTLEFSSKAFIMSPLHRMLSTHCSQRGAQGQQGFCPASGSPAGQGQGAAPHGYGWQSSSHSVTGGRVVLPGLPEPSLLCLQYGDSDPYFARLCAKWAGLTLAILSLTSEVQRRGQDRSPVVCVSLLGGWASGLCALCSAVPHATPCPRECQHPDLRRVAPRPFPGQACRMGIGL